MKHIRSTVAVKTSLVDPAETAIIIFKDFSNNQDIENGRGVITFNSYKVIPGDPEVHQVIDHHSKEMNAAEMDAMLVAIGSVTATDYTDRMAEEVLKGAMKEIDAEGFFGLTEAELATE